jgi:cell division protein FtsI (penicillin-binding protein 3)
MVNEPSFNPNNRARLKSARFRDRAVTDVFEPGSSIKPFTIAAALQSKQYVPDTRINTAPGRFRVGKYTIEDSHDYGLLTVSRVIEKSSNVGASKIALSLKKTALWHMYHSVGFGASTDSGLPGEAAGHLAPASQWGEVEHATISFGYGISVTCLQLAHA